MLQQLLYYLVLFLCHINSLCKNRNQPFTSIFRLEAPVHTQASHSHVSANLLPYPLPFQPKTELLHLS